jgi:TRAP-type uncharacterized transport system fused permease subunit
MRIAAAGFIIPYIAVYAPALMLNGADPMIAIWGFLPAVAYVTVKACIGIGLLGVATIGYFRAPCPLWERLLAFCASLLLILALPLTDQAGFALTAIFVLQHEWRRRAAQRLAAAQ